MKVMSAGYSYRRYICTEIPGVMPPKTVVLLVACNDVIFHSEKFSLQGDTLAHVKKKREELGLKYKKMYWLMGKRSVLSIHRKLMLYNKY